MLDTATEVPAHTVLGESPPSMQNDRVDLVMSPAASHLVPTTATSTPTDNAILVTPATNDDRAKLLRAFATFSELSRLTVVALLVWAILWFVAWIYEPRWSASDRWLVRLVFYLFFSFVPGDYAKVSVYWCCPDPTIRYALLSFVLAYCGILFIQLFETSHSPFFVLPLFLAPMIDTARRHIIARNQQLATRT